LAEILKNKPVALVHLLAAAKMDEELKNNLLSEEFGDPAELGKFFGDLGNEEECSKQPRYDSVDLPPFLKHVLIKIVKKALSGA
jgi:hypothetical protein